MAKKAMSKDIEVNVADLERSKAGWFCECYANHSEFMRTPWDIQLRFSKILHSAKDGGRIEEQCAVTMTYAHAKTMVGVLTQLLQDYEEREGEIILPGAGKQEPRTSSEE
jgi:hypothetical protein